jgi:hypothetical protein
MLVAVTADTPPVSGNTGGHVGGGVSGGLVVIDGVIGDAPALPTPPATSPARAKAAAASKTLNLYRIRTSTLEDYQYLH